jgi:hypothetical protein
MPWDFVRQSGKIVAMQNDPPRTDRPEPLPVTQQAPAGPGKPKETGGPPGPEPTRFGDWERAGRCIDF